MTQEITPHCGYRSGHPWYYLLGGAIPTPKQIKFHTEAMEFRGYMAADIDAAAAKPEPQRSEALRKIRAKVLKDAMHDLTLYRHYSHELRQYRIANPAYDGSQACEEIHMSMSLKTSHLINGFGHLKTLDDALRIQGDLFGF